MSAACPRCQQPLQEQQLDEFLPRICPQCRGFMIRHEELTRILELSWKVVPRRTAEERGFPTPPDWRSDPAMRCPDCFQPMEKYGYMGIGAIQIDRCDPCGLVWLDATELQNMVLALAKTNYRLETRLPPPADVLGAAAGGAVVTAGAEDDYWLLGEGGSGGLGQAGGWVLAQLLLRMLTK